ncbi:hypothetical protein ACGFJ7_11480 [Actinoplanes sp. NPDC048988]|uniref:hypothetical protein n=1 Tax=Actinoplanes sp. NPDC048988 TaxID=3363901 RepID=UPI003714F022
MRIRPATPDDIPAIAEIGAKTWPATYAFAGTDYIAHGLTEPHRRPGEHPGWPDTVRLTTREQP